MRALSLTLIGSLALATALPATAATEIKPAPAAKVSPMTEDIRCLLTMVALSQDKQRQQAAQFGVYYFMGRLTARAPVGADLTAAIKAEEPKMNGVALVGEAQRCGPLVQGAAGALRTTFAPPPGTVPMAGAPAAASAPAPAAPK